jgi:hypothetical protein
VDPKIIDLPLAMCSIALSLSRLRQGDLELRCEDSPSSSGFRYRIHTKIDINDFSMICPAIPQKPTQYHDPAAFLELIKLCQWDRLLQIIKLPWVLDPHLGDLY